MLDCALNDFGFTICLKPSKMQRQFCSLCFAPCSKLSEPIDEAARESLAQLLPHLDVETQGEAQAACTNCSTRLKGYLEFRASFFQAQASVHAFGSDESSLRQSKHAGNTTEDVAVCRICLKQATGAYVTLVEDEKALILATIKMGKCFPGLDLGTMSGCVICVSCDEALDASYNFLTSLDVENRIKKDDVVDDLEFKDVVNGRVDLNAVKEEDDWFAANAGVFEAKEDERGLQKNYKVEIEANQTDGSSVQVVAAAPGTKPKRRKNPKTTHYCHLCPYATKYSNNLKSHLIMHKSPSETPIYSCDKCSFQSKYKCAFTKHVIIHKSASETKLYRCDKCPYESKYVTGLNRHSIVHKSASETPVYRCDTCAYRTKYKYCLKLHELNHRSASELTMHKCPDCGIELKHKRSLTRHMVVHKPPEELTMYQCSFCEFRSKHKKSLKTHLLVHKGAAEVTTYKCDVLQPTPCEYETKHKSDLKKHLLTHKSTQEVEMFACDVCGYQSKRKHTLKHHMLIHQLPEELDHYTCKICGRDTKHKSYLRKHMLKHKTSEEVPLYECEYCPYKSKYKGNVKNHVRTHKKGVEASA